MISLPGASIVGAIVVQDEGHPEEDWQLEVLRRTLLALQIEYEQARG